MKKIIASLIVALLIMSTVLAFAEPLDGGWTIAENTDITDETKAIFDKALDGLVGVSYEPIAYLGSQVVAGTNYAVLCKASEINKGTAWTIVYLYQDLEGTANILSIADLPLGI